MLALRNQYGQIDLSVISPEAVSELSDGAQKKLAALIDKVQAREAAQDRYSAAVRALRAAQEEQSAALEAHRAASDPFPFVPPNPENYGTKAAYDAAMKEARECHDGRVRAYREADARRAAIAAYNSSH